MTSEKYKVLDETEDNVTCILIVDRDKRLRMSLKEVFEIEGYIVVDVEDVIDASYQFRQREPDIILLEYEAGDEGAMEFIMAITESSTGSSVPVIIMCADNQLDTLKITRAIGATDLVTKPVNIDSLRTKIVNLLTGTTDKQDR